MIRAVSAAVSLPSAPPAAARPEGATEPRDQVVLGNPAPYASGARPTGPAPAVPRADHTPEASDTVSALPTWMRLVAGGMAGLVGMVALTGCGKGTPQPTPPTTSVTDSQEIAQAKQRLEQRFQEIEKKMEASRSGDGKEQSGEVTRELMDAVTDYAKATGRSAQQVGNDLTEFMKKHPAVTLTVAFAVGTASGIALEKIGLTDGLSDGIASIKQAVEDHPLIAGLVVAGVAAGTAYLIYNYASAETAPAAPVPDTAASRELKQSMGRLEAQANASSGDAKADAAKINRSMMESVQEYAKESGRSAAQVASDVKTYLVDHPAVAASIVLAAGVGTGVVLERAGVPDAIASAAGAVLKSGKDGLGSVGQAIKDHPYLSGAIAVGVAAGAGYLIYQHVNSPAPAATPAP